jgi:hypothetical protein
MRTPLACLLASLIWIASTSAAEPAAAAGAQAAPLKLILDEDLTTQPFSRWKTLTPGESEWKVRDEWELRGGSAIAHPLRAGITGELTFALAFRPLAKSQDASGTRIGLVYANGQVGIVSLQRKREGDKTTAVVQVLRQPDILSPIGVTARTFELKDDMPKGTWKIAFRAGAINISCDGKEVGQASLETHTVPIMGVAIAQESGVVGLKRLSLRATDFPPELSSQQREQAASASSVNNEALTLYRQQKFAEATVKSREALERFRKLHGEQHPDVANALYNLATVLRRDGKGAEAIPLFEKAIEIRRQLFGADHPDTGLLHMELAGLLVERMQLEEAFPHCLAANGSFARYYGPEDRTTIVTQQMLDKLPRPKRKDET